MSFLFLGPEDRAATMRAVFAREAPDVPFFEADDGVVPADIRYLATWTPPADLAATYPDLALIFSTGAGVDQFDLAALPPAMRLVRLVEPALTGGMVDYVLGAVLSLHRDFFAYQRAQRDEVWQPGPMVAAADRRVSILGIGALGGAVIDALRPFGFQLAAWSRSPRDLAGVTHFAGERALDDMLARTDILVCLLPLTAETDGLLDARRLRAMPRGAMLVNAARGRHVVEADLIAALDEGHVSQAILDVAAIEPLPPGHPYWRHPNILLTPHIASVTDHAAAARAMIANIRRHGSDEPLVGLVERSAGY